MADSEAKQTTETVNTLSSSFVFSCVWASFCLVWKRSVFRQKSINKLILCFVFLISYVGSWTKVQVNEKNLKYMEFVQVAAIYVVVCFSSLYECAKENSGPLKPGVQTVEGTVKTVIGPVYEKFHDLPFQLLKFVDRKVSLIQKRNPRFCRLFISWSWSRGLQVDESLSELDRHVPCLVKQASSQALSVAQKAPVVARTVASEVQRAGLVDTARNLTVSVYAKYEPVAEEVFYKYERYAVSAWRSLNGLPLFPQVAQIMVPTVAYWSAKYNQAVGYTADRGYSVAAYLPLIPTERIAKVFDDAENGPAVSTSGGAVAMEQWQPLIWVVLTGLSFLCEFCFGPVFPGLEL